MVIKSLPFKMSSMQSLGTSLSFLDFSKKALKEDLCLSRWEYFYEYLKGLKKEKYGDKYKIIILIENEYVDKYYLRDYAKYYAEAFSQNKRFTKRIYFFVSGSNKEDFEKKIKRDLKWQKT